jgi:hypothetical protein
VRFLFKDEKLEQFRKKAFSGSQNAALDPRPTRGKRILIAAVTRRTLTTRTVCAFTVQILS